MQTAAVGERDKQLCSDLCGGNGGFKGRRRERGGGTVESLGRVREVENYKKLVGGCFLRNVRQARC